MSQALQSSQSFVRALKAPSDPPQPDGPSKVEIARQAWENTSFYVPNKGEVIVEWLLTKLLKDKSNQCVAFIWIAMNVSDFSSQIIESYTGRTLLDLALRCDFTYRT